MNDEQLDKLEQLKAQSDAGGGRDKATTSNFVLYNLYRTAVMDAAPELLAAARENAALRRELEKDAPLALKARQWRRAEEAAGEGRTMDELRTLDRIAADYRRELWELAAPDTEAEVV